MPQSEDKLALDALNKEIIETEAIMDFLEYQLIVNTNKLNRLNDKKKSMENYLNSDNN